MTGIDQARAAELRRRLAETRERAAEEQPGAPLQLTPVQRDMWMAETLGTVGSAYTLLRVWRMAGPLDLDALDRSIGQVIARHDAFEMRIVQDDGTPRPVFAPAPVWRGVEAELPQGDDPEAWLTARLAALSGHRFQLDRGPLFAVHLMLMGPDDVVLVWVLHHIIADDWSFSVIAQDLGHFYALQTGRDAAPLPSTGAGYSGHLRPPPGGTGLAGDAPLPGGPASSDTAWPRNGLAQPNPDDPARARTAFGSIPGADLAIVQRAAREIGVSTYALMAAVYQTLLARFCDDTTILLGVSRTVRLSTQDDARVGMFLDHVQLSADAAPGRVLGDIARDIARAVRDKPRSAFGPSGGGASGATFVLYSDRTLLPDLAGIDCTVCEPPERGIAVDLHLGVNPTGDGAAVLLTGRVSQFDASTLERLLAVFLLHLSIIGTAEQPAQISVWDLPLFPSPEARQQMLDLAEKTGPYPDDQSIAARFHAVATAQGDAPAVRTPHLRWTYGALAKEAAALADWLGAAGLTPGDVIGLALPRGADLIRATFGALQAGLTIAPIDPDYPEARRSDMPAQAGCKLILADDRLLGSALARSLPPVLGDAPAPPQRGPVAMAPDSVAYIVFTSGSTGRPKGVATTHRAIQRLAAGLGPRVPGPGDRLALIASPSFDGCFIEIFGALLNGAELVSPQGDLGDHRDIAALFRDNAVTKGFVTTGLFNLILDNVPGAFASFDWVAVGGEAMSPTHAHRFLRDYPGVDLLNVYGPTENGALTTSHRVQPTDAGPVPIGTPMPGNTALVLGIEGTPVPPGFAGELWVGGPGLALRYVGLAQQTAAAFRQIDRHKLGLPGDGAIRLYATGDRVVQRPDGALCYNGRRDAQIKLSGYRIEPREIEAAIRRIDGVQDAMVIPRRTGPGGAVTAIDAGVVGVPALFEGNGAALRRRLRQDLPGIMIPARFCRVQALPLTPNGKRDAAALARLIDQAKPDAAVPAAGSDTTLAAIWNEFVGPPDAGRDSDFFTSGGHSLGAMQMLAEVERRFERRIPISDFFDNPTLGGLQDLLQGTGHGAPKRHLVLMRDGPRNVPPLIAVMGLRGASLWARDMVDALPASCGAVYGLNLAADDREADGVVSLSQLAQDMVDEILSEFSETPVRLIGYSFAGFLAFALATELERRGRQADRLILIDPNTNLGATNGPPPAPTDVITARLSALRANYRLSPIRGSVDFIFCANAFPKPRLPDAEEWATLSGGGLSLYTLHTSHLAVVYGAWANVLARTVSGLLEGTRPPDAMLDIALEAADIARIYAARDALAAGRPAEAIAESAPLMARLNPVPIFLRVLHAQMLAQTNDQQTLRAIASAEIRKAQPDAAFLGALSRLLRQTGEAPLAQRVNRRLFDCSGSDVHGAFNLVAASLLQDRLWQARWVAHLASRRGRSPLTGLLCKAAIARHRGERAKAFDLILQATGRSDMSVPHLVAIMDSILRRQDHVFALSLISAAEQVFKGGEIISRLRRDWESRARAEAAKASVGQPVQ